MIAVFTNGHSALLNLVALVSAKAWIICRAPCVALAYLLGVLIVGLAPVAEEERRLDACATHLHGRCIGVRHKLWCQGVALVQGTLTSPITKNWLVLNGDLLVDVQPILCCTHLACSGCRKASEESKKLQRLHQRKGCTNAILSAKV